MECFANHGLAKTTCARSTNDLDCKQYNKQFLPCYCLKWGATNWGL